MNVELPVYSVRESGIDCTQQRRRRAECRELFGVWQGLLKSEQMTRTGREAECEKAKLTQTLSITFHLTRADDNVDMRPRSAALPWDWLLAWALSTTGWRWGVGGWHRSSRRDHRRWVVYLKPWLKSISPHCLFICSFFPLLTYCSVSRWKWLEAQAMHFDQEPSNCKWFFWEKREGGLFLVDNRLPLVSGVSGEIDLSLLIRLLFEEISN